MKKRLKSNLFHNWMSEMGYHGRQVVVAGESIGLTKGRSYELSQGGEPKLTERLAMAAALAGIDPLTTENMDDIMDIATTMRALERIVDRNSQNRTPDHRLS